MTMGFRFRKSIKIGNARINLSKSGVGYSFGTKGFRYTKKANGGTRTTTSISGTGISYVQDSKKSKRGTTMRNNSAGKFLAEQPRRQNNHNSDTPVTKAEMILVWCTGFIGGHKFYRKKYGMGILYVLTAGLFLIGWLGDSISITWQYFIAKKGKQSGNLQKVISYITAFLCVCMLGSCGGSNEASVPPATESTQTNISVFETTVETETTTTQEETTTVEPIETATQENQEIEEQTSTPAFVEPEQPKEEMVWIPTNGGTKYHSRSSCSNMDNPREVTVSEAQTLGFSPCKKCY